MNSNLVCLSRPTFEEFVLFLDEESKVFKHPWLKKPMNPSHCMATVCEPIPPVDPKPIIVDTFRVCSPPSLMSLHVRIPPLMSLSVFPWFCLKTDPPPYVNTILERRYSGVPF